MLLDLLSPNNYVNYNIKLAHILGLKPAIYISELLNINDKAVRKKKIQDNKFKVDRKYLFSRTTLIEEEQLDIENTLCQIGIISKNDTEITLNVDILASMMLEENENLIVDLKDYSEKHGLKKKTKKEKITENLYENIPAKNTELVESYKLWIDSVIAKQGWLSKAALFTAAKTIDAYANHDLDVALEVLSIAAVNGYRDINWAIKRYEELKKTKQVGKKYKPIDVKISKEVF